jgi:hypothetical protein
MAMLPCAPIGRSALADVPENATALDASMEIRPALFAVTADQLLEQAREYRRMAVSATTPEMRNTLNQLAIGFAMFAAWR